MLGVVKSLKTHESEKFRLVKPSTVFATVKIFNQIRQKIIDDNFEFFFLVSLKRLTWLL